MRLFFFKLNSQAYNKKSHVSVIFQHFEFYRIDTGWNVDERGTTKRRCKFLMPPLNAFPSSSPSFYFTIQSFYFTFFHEDDRNFFTFDINSSRPFWSPFLTMPSIPKIISQFNLLPKWQKRKTQRKTKERVVLEDKETKIQQHRKA